jgi:hypothetical protein
VSVLTVPFSGRGGFRTLSCQTWSRSGRSGLKQELRRPFNPSHPAFQGQVPYVSLLLTNESAPVLDEVQVFECRIARVPRPCDDSAVLEVVGRYQRALVPSIESELRR